MIERFVLWLLDNWTPKDPEKLIRRLIKQYKLNKHLHENPIRKDKRTNGAAII